VTHLLSISFAAAMIAVASPAAAQPESEPPAPPRKGARWSLALGGGALAPVRDMREGYQDALVAGLRFGVRARSGVGMQLGVDYSPLPRRPTSTETFDTTYGTVVLVPSLTIGHGTLRVQVGAGGGIALEQATARDPVPTSDTTYAAAALAQVGVELHVTDGGGLILLGGATRTFGDREYEYAWGMGGLTLEF
jgi:opacity protein-like surface antigen